MERTLSNRTGTETSKQTIANLVDNFIRRGNIEANKGRNKTQSVCTNDVNIYKLVENNVSLPENVPLTSCASINRSLTQDLGY